MRIPKTSHTIIVSYTFIMSLYRRAIKCIDALETAKTDSTVPIPQRPDLSIMADILNDSQYKSPYLVLNEANVIKNEKSITFAAISVVRQTCKTCVMLTGTPIDNTWPEIFAFSALLGGHHIKSKQEMIKLLDGVSSTGASRVRARSVGRGLKF